MCHTVKGLVKALITWSPLPIRAKISCMNVSYSTLYNVVVTTILVLTTQWSTNHICKFTNNQSFAKLRRCFAHKRRLPKTVNVKRSKLFINC